MEEKKTFEMDQKKKWIAVAIAILVLILLLLLLLRSCGGKGGDSNSTDGNSTDGGASTTTTTTTTTSANADIGYDEELVSTWYKDVTAMVLNEDGVGSLYYGDEDGGEIRWHTSGNRLTLTIAGKTSVVTYAISGDDLTLTYDDGKVESWFR